MGKENDRRRQTLRANLLLLKSEAKIDMTTFSEMLKAKDLKVCYSNILAIYGNIFASEKSLNRVEPFVEDLMKEYKLPFNSCSGQTKPNGEVR